jgi:hypothetical protein
MPQFNSAADADAFYKAVPLVSEGGPQIRILRVHAVHRSKPLTCALYTMSLANKLPYNALSYSWAYQGETHDPLTHSILCNEIPVAITENLHAALRRLQCIERWVDVWVDWLCINQGDLGERAMQVGLMRQIYEGSEEVIIWLGDRGPNEDLGSHLLRSSDDVKSTLQSHAPLIDW